MTTMTIRREKRRLKRLERNIFINLKNDAQLFSRFKYALKNRNASGLGETITNQAVVPEGGWQNNRFLNDLFDLGVDVARSNNINRDERRVLDAQLNNLIEGNKSLNLQIQANRSMGGSFIDELTDSPLKMVMFAGLGFWLFKSITDRKRRR